MNLLLKILFLLWLISGCLFFPEVAVSQYTPGNATISTRHLTMKDGLAGKQVNCGMQDSRGFIWFGTTHGLQRYDGKNFKLFTKEKDSLQDNNIVKLAEDQNHLLWIMYATSGSDMRKAGRVDVLDLGTYTLQTVSQKLGAAMPFKEDGINVIKANEKNELLVNVNHSPGHDVLWFYSKAGGFKQIATGVTGSLRNRFYFKGNRIMYIYNDTTTAIFADDGRPAFFQSHILDHNFQYHPLGIGPDGSYFIVSGSRLRASIFKMHPLVIYQATGDGRLHAIPNQFSHAATSTVDEVLTESFSDPSMPGIIFVQDKKWVFAFDGKDYFQLMDSSQLSEYRYPLIFDYFATGTGHHWLCTSEGVIEIVVKPNHFTHLLSNDVIKLPLAIGYQSRSIYADSSGIYATCWDGFYRITQNNSGSYNYQKIAGPATIGEGDGFYFDGKYFWLTQTNYGIRRTNFTGSEASHYPANAGSVWTGITTHEGKLFIGTTDKLVLFEEGSFRNMNFCNGSNDYHNWFYQLFYSRDGKLWAVSNKGLLTIKDGCINDQYSAEAKDKKFKIPFTDIHGVFEDKDDNFWLATNGAGLIKWNRKENTFLQFTIADGLSSNVLYAVLEDDMGFLWISSEYGLMRFDPVSHFVKTYTTDDGITSDEFNRISYFKAADGQLFFGGLNGINAFYPKDFISDSTVAQTPVRLISFNKFSAKEDRLVDQTNELLTQNKIVMQPGDRFFNLEFQLLDFEEGKSNYAYMIKDFDKDWNYISDNSIRISGLPYGKYTLYVKGQSHNGQWSKSELKIPLLVLKPFYLQWWFIILAGISLGLIFFLLYKQRVKQLVSTKLRLEKEVLSRTKDLKESLAQQQVLLAQEHTLLKEKDVLLKEIHHRVKNNLQVISGLLELQEKNLSDEQAKQALREGRTRVRSIALIHQNLYQYENLSRIELNSFVNDLYKQVSRIFEDKLKDTTTSINIPVTEIDIDTAVPFGLALNELLTNSFKYGYTAGKSFSIEMALTSEKYNAEEGNKYIFVYSDTGPGLPTGFDMAKSKSLGMRLVNELSKQMGGSLRYTFENGSRFTILFSDKKERKKND